MDSVMVAVIFGLVALNGVFVGAEFALIRTPLASLERRRKGWVSSRLAAILRSPRQQDRYIVTTQLGVTSASLGLGMYGEHRLADALGDMLGASGWTGDALAHGIASTVAIAVLTYLHVVVGEMVPKSIALARPLRFALIVTPLVLGMRTVLLPFVLGVEWAANRILRRLGVRRRMAEVAHRYTPQDLRHIVEESSEQGALKGVSADVLAELFDFAELTAAEVMVPRVAIVGIPVGSSSESVAEIVERERHTRYPVYEGDLDHVLGAVHVKDLILAIRAGRSVTPNMARPVPFVPETSRLDRVLAAMRAARSHMAIVMDEHGGTAGLVTVEDLFEEVVDIPEQGDARGEQIQERDGRLLVAGTVRLEEVGERLGKELEHEEADTVSGLVLTLLERPARVGDEVVYEGVRFRVAEVEGHGVGRAEVIPERPSGSRAGERDEDPIE